MTKPKTKAKSPLELERMGTIQTVRLMAPRLPVDVALFLLLTLPARKTPQLLSKFQVQLWHAFTHTLHSGVEWPVWIRQFLWTTMFMYASLLVNR